MSTLLKLSGREVTKVFEKFGWQIVRQRGSHMIMVKDEQIVTLLTIGASLLQVSKIRYL